MKYIIDLEKIPNTELYKAVGFNTLVFDQIGINKLTPYQKDLKDGDIIRTVNGKVLYEFKGYSNDGKKINCINLSNGCYSMIPRDKAMLV